jgi:hypothetical protein
VQPRTSLLRCKWSFMARFDSSPRCNGAFAIGGKPDMQMVILGNHGVVNDPELTPSDLASSWWVVK